MLTSARSWLGRNRLVVGLAIFAAVFFCYSYASNPNRPGAYPDQRVSWNYWFDQGEYLKEARAIRAGNLDRSQYTYPMGYPAIGAVFVGAMHRNPFFIFDLTAFVFVILLYYLIAREFFGPNTAFISSSALILATPLVYYTVVPWTTTATLPAVVYLMYLGFVKARLRYLDAVALALLLVLAYMARGGGEILLLVPFGLAVVQKFWSEDAKWVKFALVVGIFALGIIISGLWTKAIFGTLTHPYIKAVAAIGFNVRRIPSSFWGTIVFSGRAGGYWQSLLGGAFWFVVAPVGMLLALRKPAQRWLNLGLILSLVLGFAVTTSFNNYDASTLKYNSLHYLKIWFPALALYSTSAVTAFLKSAKPKP